MTDTDFLERVLADGTWHSHGEILSRSELERGCGLTVHSRASDLRKRGRTVEVDLRRVNGRTVSYYRCVLDEPGQGTVAAVGPGSSSTSSNPGPSHPLGANEEATAYPTGDGDVLLIFDEHDQARIFACDIDESAGLRGAYGDAA